MFAGNSPTRTGLMAGGIAMMTAILVMQLVSLVLGPDPLFTFIMPNTLLGELIRYTGGLANFLTSGNVLVRSVVTLLIIFLALGAILAAWADDANYVLRDRVMQAAALLFFITFTLMYLSSSWHMKYFLQPIMIALAIGFLAYAVVVYWLLEPGTTRQRWMICTGIAGASLIHLAWELWTF